MSAYLELSCLTKAYPGPDGPTVVVEDFRLDVAQGELVCLLGHSGCGKSTVLAMVAGLVAPTSGGVILDGREIDGPGPDRGVVFQSPSLLPWLTVSGNVMLGVRRVFRHGTPAERARIVRHYLRLVGLVDCDRLRPHELSQGMRQRVGLARAFALAPKVLLLDEPFGMLDSLTRLELQVALTDLWLRDRKTALMVTHDVDEALFLADRIVMMTNGPRARVGEIVHVPFERPRQRTRVLDHPEYYPLRERLLAFLAAQEVLASEVLASAKPTPIQIKPPAKPATTAKPPTPPPGSLRAAYYSATATLTSAARPTTTLLRAPRATPRDPRAPVPR